MRITTVNPRGVAETHDVPGTIAGVAAAIVAADGGELMAGVRTAEIVMLQLLDFREPVVQPTPD